MKKSMILKVCSIILVMAMCLLTVTGCNGTTGTSSVEDTSSLNSRPGTSSNTSSDTSSDVTSTDDTSSGDGESISVPDKIIVESTVTTTQTIPFDASKNPLQRGVNFSGLESEGQEFGYDSWIFQGKYYDLLRERGFDHVRVPIDFFQHMGEAPDYTINEEFLRKIDIIVNLALSAGLKIVLDAHHFAGDLQVNVKGNEPRYYKMWEQLAVHYQNYPSGVVFELINEPGNASQIRPGGPDVVTADKILRIQENAIKIIRKTNPTRIIVHATRWNNGAAQLMDTEPLLPDDKNIIMSVHSYEPMPFTHQGMDWDNDGIPTYPGNADFTEEMHYEIELVFKMIKDYQEKYGRPVWIGEFGVLKSKAPAEAITKYSDFIVKTMKDAKCGWCWWEFNGGFGIYSTEADKWVNEAAMNALMQ